MFLGNLNQKSCINNLYAAFSIYKSRTRTTTILILG